jgi:poly-gamma-glutamate synthesis protein (capsule biosynthesis protein)
MALVPLVLCGDVMTGRGIDQVLPHAGDPRLHEPYAQSAVEYVQLAEGAHGPIPRPVDFAYVWGDALAELASPGVRARIVNLETSITRCDDHWRGKDVHYRMHPDNVTCLKSALIDCCVVANNHTLDYGHAGLIETLDTLKKVGVKCAGAGRSLAEAEAPAIVDVAGGGRVIVFGFGAKTSGIPGAWAATQGRPGVDMLADLSERTVDRIAARIRTVKRAGDVVVASIHWGGNWGFAVPREHVRFAHALVQAGVDIIHGHSSHHVRPIEVFEGKLILYGCGDFLDDYEGIGGHEEFRDDLALLYAPTVDPANGRLADLRMPPMQIRNFRLNRASGEDAAWLRDTLNRMSARFGFQVALHGEDRLDLQPA